MLRAGGNAVDAAVAAALAGGVVQPQSSGLGGGGFALVVGPEVGPIVLDFREVAPAAARADMFLDAEGAVVPGLSEHGPLAVAVPGEPRGLAALEARYGRLGLEAVAAPAVRLAREGFPAGQALAAAAEAWHEEHGDALFPLLFDGCAAPPAEGQVLRRARLAASLEAWAASGGEALNSGPLAEGLASGLQAEGGILTAADLAGYTVRDRAPLLASYRGWTILTTPPPSSGGLVLLQALQVLAAWPPLGPDPLAPVEVHRAVEALKHGFADRAHWMGDPDFVDVPVGDLLGSAHIAAVQVLVRLTGEPPAAPTPEFSDEDCRTLPSGVYGLPLDPGDDGGTAHISVLDDEGMAVALTTTINTSFGSGVVDPGTGLLLNDELDDFVAAPGVPNAYGLVGNARNAIAPGKRPLSSMSPTVVLDAQGTPLLVVGASGGPRIITGTLQVLRAVLESGLSPTEALALPRYHHQWSPDLLQREPGLLPGHQPRPGGLRPHPGRRRRQQRRPGRAAPPRWHPPGRLRPAQGRRPGLCRSLHGDSPMTFRSTWLLLAASALCLAAGGAALLRMEHGLARAEAAAEALAEHDQPARAEQALDAWGRPWLETFLRLRDRPPAEAEALAPCQAALLARLDTLSVGKNQVLHTRIRQAKAEAATCAAPTLGAELSDVFVRELRVRWDTWLAHELPDEGR
ncbi:MAG: gamma-glutamyltransferase, partial [Pseudomonadota bacterium]